MNSVNRTNLLCSIILAGEAVGIRGWNQSATYKFVDTELGENLEGFSLAILPVYKL